MLSSTEIRSIEFEKCMRGYRPEQVEETLDKIAAQLEQVQKEKDDMEKKLYILAGKVEEYRNEEDMLKTAMINAQRMGESVIKEARQKAERILRESDLQASLIDEKAKEKLQAEEERFIELQEKVAMFKAEVLGIYKKHIESLSDLPVDENLFGIEDKYAEVDDTNFANVITSQAELTAEAVIETFDAEDEDEYIFEPITQIQEEVINASEPEITTSTFAEFSDDIEPDPDTIEDIVEEEPVKDRLGLNGIDYDRIGLDDDVKVFDSSSLIMNDDDDDIIEMPPLKKSVFDIFGDTN